MTTPTPDPTPVDRPSHRRRGRGTTDVISDRTATVVIYVVTAIWAVNIIAGMFSWNGYSPSTEVNGIFMVVVGGAFIARNRARDGD